MHAGELTRQRFQGVLGLGVIHVQAGLSLERNFEGDLLPLGHVQFGKRIKSAGVDWLGPYGWVVGTSPSFCLSRRAVRTVAKESNVKPTPPQPATVQDCCTGRRQL